MQATNRVVKTEKTKRTAFVPGASERAQECRKQKQKRVKRQRQERRSKERAEANRIKCGGYKV